MHIKFISLSWINRKNLNEKLLKIHFILKQNKERGQIWKENHRKSGNPIMREVSTTTNDKKNFLNDKTTGNVGVCQLIKIDSEFLSSTEALPGNRLILWPTKVMRLKMLNFTLLGIQMKDERNEDEGKKMKGTKVKEEGCQKPHENTHSHKFLIDCRTKDYTSIHACLRIERLSCQL